MLRLCRSTSTRKASWSPPRALATTCASSECICFIRRVDARAVRSVLPGGTSSLYEKLRSCVRFGRRSKFTQQIRDAGRDGRHAQAEIACGVRVLERPVMTKDLDGAAGEEWRPPGEARAQLLGGPCQI